jgi:hypothetical protein
MAASSPRGPRTSGYDWIAPLLESIACKQREIQRRLDRKHFGMFRAERDPEHIQALSIVYGNLGDIGRGLVGAAANNVPNLELTRVQIEQDLQHAHGTTVETSREYGTQLHLDGLLLVQRQDIHGLLQLELRRDTLEKGAARSWSGIMDPALLDKLIGEFKTDIGAETCSEAIATLRLLFAQRQRLTRIQLARQRVKAAYMLWMTCLLFALSVGFAAGLVLAPLPGDTGWAGTLILVAFAGALGSALSSVLRLRDQIARLGDLRAFWPIAFAQPFVGAATGLVVYLILQTGIVHLGDVDTKTIGASAQGLVAFLAGFSEPFFLGTVQRLSTSADTALNNT